MTFFFGGGGGGGGLRALFKIKQKTAYLFFTFVTKSEHKLLFVCPKPAVELVAHKINNFMIIIIIIPHNMYISNQTNMLYVRLYRETNAEWK